MIEKNAPALVFLQVGDFYESYFEQADEIGSLCDILSVTRQFGKESIQVAGFPCRSLAGKLEVLVGRHGKSVAIVDQVDEPGAKGGRMKSRRVVRVVTPGTLLDEDFANYAHNNVCLAIYAGSTGIGLAWSNIAAGSLHIATSDVADVELDLFRISPREIVIDESLSNVENHPVMEILLKYRHEWQVTKRPSSEWDEDHARLRMEAIVHHTVGANESEKASPTPGRRRKAKKSSQSEQKEAQDLSYEMHEIIACSALQQYLSYTQGGDTPTLKPPVRFDRSQHMTIDPHTTRHLELFKTQREGKSRGSLFWSVNNTRTAAGSRLLLQRVGAPSTSVPLINSWLDLAESFLSSKTLLGQILKLLQGCKDIERGMQKLALGRGRYVDRLCFGMEKLAILIEFLNQSFRSLGHHQNL